MLTLANVKLIMAVRNDCDVQSIFYSTSQNYVAYLFLFHSQFHTNKTEMPTAEIDPTNQGFSNVSKNGSVKTEDFLDFLKFQRFFLNFQLIIRKR